MRNDRIARFAVVGCTALVIAACSGGSDNNSGTTSGTSAGAVGTDSASMSGGTSGTAGKRSLPVTAM